MKTVVVTRHNSLVEYLREEGIVDSNVEVVEHATAENVTGNHVIGVLPIHLAELTEKYTNVAINVPAELRGSELTLDQVRQYASAPKTYKVIVLD